jgi:phosphoglycerol transferase MdoB-like AlkP superfamily enzyme
MNDQGSPISDVQHAARPTRQFLGPVLSFLGLGLLVLQLSRLGLLLWQFDRVSETEGWTYILAQGLRFDLVALCGLLLVPSLVLPWLYVARRTRGFVSRFLPLLLAAALATLFFMELATPSFIEEYDTRPNYLFVEYLKYPTEVMATLWGAYPMQLILSAILVPLLARVVYRRFRTRAGEAQPVPLAQAAGLAIVLPALCAIGVRSTLEHRPVNPSTVCFSGDAMVNALPMSSLYSVGYAIYEMRKNESGDGTVYATMPYEEVLDMVRADSGLPLDGFTDPTIPTLHTQIATRPRERPLNFVIVLEESLGAEFVGSMGGLDLTPELDKLREQGMSFDRLYATGTRSVRGIEAVVTGFLPTPVRSVVKLPRSQRDFFTVAELLAREGYATSFLYGGEAHFDNMARFFTGNGFETIIDHKDYADPIFEGSWGVSDQDLFRRAHEQFEQMGDQPFFSLVFTSSNHSPWDFPEGQLELVEQPAATRNNSVRYADHALGGFFDLARMSSYWENTVFLVVADHNSRVYGPDLVPVERFHIPAVFLGGAIEAEHVDQLASQVDLLPTALSLIGIDAEHPCLGRDLTDSAQLQRPGRAILQFHQTNLYWEEDCAVILRPGLPPSFFSIQNDRLGEVIPADSVLERRALGHALWPQMSYTAGDYRLPLEAEPE